MQPSLTISELHEGELLWLGIDRPKGNVLTGEVMDELCDAVVRAQQRPNVKLIAIEGVGPNFSYGASVEEHLPAAIGAVLPRFRRLILAVASSPVPVAAVVRGMCYGGAFELVMACHFVFCAKDARMALPEIKLGVYPPPACVLLPGRVGQSLAERLILTGGEVTVSELQTTGFLTRTYPSDGLRAGVDDWFASNLAPLSASSLRHASAAARAAMCDDLEQRLLAAEEAYLGPLMATHDAAEGVAAFVEKRRPSWRNS